MRTFTGCAKRFLSIGLSVYIGILSDAALAQNTPFSHVDITIGGYQNIPGSDAFYEYFGTGFGAGASLRTPFYVGNADVGVQWHKYRKNVVTVPKMTAFFVYAGWGYPLRLGAVEIEPGLRLGNYRMMFELNNAFRSELDESEFTTSLQATARLALGERASLHLEASRMTVYTYNRLYYTYLGAGLSYRVRTSGRIQEALRQ